MSRTKKEEHLFELITDPKRFGKCLLLRDVFSNLTGDNIIVESMKDYVELIDIIDIQSHPLTVIEDEENGMQIESLDDRIRRFNNKILQKNTNYELHKDKGNTRVYLNTPSSNGSRKSRIPGSNTYFYETLFQLCLWDNERTVFDNEGWENTLHFINGGFKTISL